MRTKTSKQANIVVINFQYTAGKNGTIKSLLVRGITRDLDQSAFKFKIAVIDVNYSLSSVVDDLN